MQGYFSPFRETAAKLGAGNIGQGIMVFAEGAIKSKMHADISGGYSCRILRHGRVK